VKVLRFSIAAALVAIIIPIVPLTSSVAEAALLPGASAYTAVTPARLADTRDGQPGSDGFTRLDDHTIRVQVTGRANIPAGATAAVLNITAVNARTAAFVTAYPADNPRPVASSLNVDQPRRIIGNLATVQLSQSGAVELYVNQPLDLVVDVAGAYVPVTESVASGRLFTIPGGARRVLDTREGGGPVTPGTVKQVSLASLGVPADATGVVFNLAATEGGSGFWTAYPSGVDRPLASSLYIDQVGQTRNGQGIVALAPGERSFNVFSFGGGHLIIDVVGWFTGSSHARSTDGLFVPSSPIRMRDTRHDYAIAPWGGSTIEFSSGAELSSLSGQVAAVAMNLAIAEPLDVGFVTAFPAGVARPLAANLNISALDQIISNHAIVRVGQRGVSLFTQSGTHMIVDVTGWYLGSPDLSSLPPPANPSTATTMGVRIDAPSGGIGVNIGYATTSAAIDAVVDGGRAVLYGGNGTLGGPDHNIYFAHRTQISAGRPFTNIHRMAIGDTFTLAGQDGRRYKYLVTVGPSVIHGTDAQGLINLVLSGGPVTATLVACHPPTSTTYRILVVGRLIGLA
jgi:hypothetical protein